ncbi:hypothetical protein ACHAWO_013622 [Cyclotella atomus]|uniref:Uncharacterized protein n=1 Tax=Cyclotella atomus TaxID=382360 RepID=A0ABD3PUY2_9STRA
MEMEDQSALHIPLLAPDDQHQPINANISNDDAILSQLSVPSGQDHTQTKKSHRSCHNCCTTKNKEMPTLFTFAILTWLGFVLTLYATYSCNLIHITWNPHSIHLSISAVGIHRFEQTIHNIKKQIKEIKCFDQSSYIQHAEISSDSKHFFPSDEFVIKASRLAPILSGVAFTGVMIYMIVASIYVDAFTKNRLNYPWKTLSACYISVGLILVAAGTAELLTILDLLNDAGDPTNDHGDSPICNVNYSSCGLGMGGNIAVGGVVCCYGAALLAFLVAYVTIADAMSAKRGDKTDRPVQHATVGSLS